MIIDEALEKRLKDDLWVEYILHCWAYEDYLEKYPENGVGLWITEADRLRIAIESSIFALPVPETTVRCVHRYESGGYCGLEADANVHTKGFGRAHAFESPAPRLYANFDGCPFCGHFDHVGYCAIEMCDCVSAPRPVPETAAPCVYVMRDGRPCMYPERSVVHIGQFGPYGHEYEPPAPPAEPVARCSHWYWTGVMFVRCQGDKHDLWPHSCDAKMWRSGDARDYKSETEPAPPAEIVSEPVVSSNLPLSMRGPMTHSSNSGPGTPVIHGEDESLAEPVEEVQEPRDAWRRAFAGKIVEVEDEGARPLSEIRISGKTPGGTFVRVEWGDGNSALPAGQALREIAEERRRQIEELGWSPSHDWDHTRDDWQGFIDKYAARGEWVKVGALALAAREAELRRPL